MLLERLNRQGSDQLRWSWLYRKNRRRIGYVAGDATLSLTYMSRAWTALWRARTPTSDFRLFARLRLLLPLTRHEPLKVRHLLLTRLGPQLGIGVHI